MRICIFSAGIMESHLVLERLIPQYSQDIVALCLSKGGIGPKKKSTIHLIREFFRKAGLSYVMYHVFEGLSFPLARLMKKFKGKPLPKTCTEVAKDYGIEIIEAEDINHPDMVKKIAELKPDLILSVYFDRILKKPILEIPSLGCVNVHPSLLPDFRGFNPLFWALRMGKKRWAHRSIT